MSDFKDLLTEYNDFPMECLKEEFQKFMVHSPREKVMFIHIREPKEIERAVEIFDAKTILVVNPNVKKVTSNHADLNVENYDYDIFINNDGSLEDLKNIAKRFCESQRLI